MDDTGPGDNLSQKWIMKMKTFCVEQGTSQPPPPLGHCVKYPGVEKYIEVGNDWLTAEFS